MTSATNPSLEDIITGAIPACRRSSSTTRSSPTRSARTSSRRGSTPRPASSTLRPRHRGLAGNEKINGDGYWTGFGVNPASGQPITVNEWVDRLAAEGRRVVAVGTCATYGGIPAMKNNPTGAMGLRDYLGWNWKSKAGIPIVNIPAARRSPTT
jgi:hydrogenase small subunit